MVQSGAVSRKWISNEDRVFTNAVVALVKWDPGAPFTSASIFRSKIISYALQFLGGKLHEGFGIGRCIHLNFL